MHKWAVWMAEKLKVDDLGLIPGATASASSSQCQHGESHMTTALTLQAFLGWSGAGFLYIDRFDLFWIAIGCLVGPCLFTCVMLVCFYDILAPETEVDGNMVGMAMTCVACLCPIATVVMWVWGIVIIANRGILDGAGCGLV